MIVNFGQLSKLHFHGRSLDMKMLIWLWYRILRLIILNSTKFYIHDVFRLFFHSIGIDDDIFNSGKERLELEEIYRKKTFSAKQVVFKEFILFIIIASIVGSAQFCRRNQYSDAFIYYKPYQNETRIIKVRV